MRLLTVHDHRVLSPASSYTTRWTKSRTIWSMHDLKLLGRVSQSGKWWQMETWNERWRMLKFLLQDRILFKFWYWALSSMLHSDEAWRYESILASSPTYEGDRLIINWVSVVHEVCLRETSHPHKFKFVTNAHNCKVFKLFYTVAHLDGYLFVCR